MPVTILSQTIFKTSDFKTSGVFVSTKMSVPDPPKESELIALENEFSWPMFMPAIISGGGCRSGSLWGVFTSVCCENSSDTFSVTIFEKTKRSIKPSCEVAATWEGWEETTAGTKSVFWQVTSPTCSTESGTFSLVMENGKYYFFQFEGVNNELKVMIYIGDACTVTQNTQAIELQSLLDSTVGKEKLSFQQIKEIRLDISPDAFKANRTSTHVKQFVAPPLVRTFGGISVK